MKRAFKIAFAVAVVVYLTPILFTAATVRDVDGYFQAGRCACGYDLFIHITGDGYARFAPGHGETGRRLTCALRPRAGGWELLALGPPDGMWSPVEKDAVVGHLRFQDGALWESYSGGTNWTRHARVYNLWPIWWTELRVAGANLLQ